MLGRIRNAARRVVGRVRGAFNRRSGQGGRTSGS